MLNRIFQTYSKNAFVLSIVFSLFILFHKLFEIALSKFIVTPFLSTIQSGTINDSIFIFFLLLAIGWTYGKFNNYIPSSRILTIYVIFSFAYIYYRMHRTPKGFHFSDFLGFFMSLFAIYSMQV